MNRYHVVWRCPEGSFLGVMSGMGKNRGTWDAEHSRRSAQRHAAKLRRERPAHRFSVEPST